VHTPAVELDAELSPDGRWLAYQSDESGRVEIFVRRYPEIDAGRWQASTEGGTRPLWARSGRELFYFDASGSLLSVEVDPSAATFVAKNPKIVIASKYYMGFTGLGLDLRAYDVSRDGRRFLMLRDTPNPSPTSTPQANLIVVLHWIEELKARLPAK
jgi:hypothetical protein